MPTLEVDSAETCVHFCTHGGRAARKLRIQVFLSLASHIAAYFSTKILGSNTTSLRYFFSSDVQMDALNDVLEL